MTTIASKSILVTGGAGFIGSHLCDFFISKNHYVVCLDNFLTGHRSNIEHLLDHPNFQLIAGDIRSPETCKKAVQNIDFVLHQAALGSVPRSVLDPITTNDINVSGFLNMLFAAKNAGVQRFVYASSSSVYGDSQQLPKVEHTIGNPLSPYATTKLTNELYAAVFSQTYGMETIGLRYFNVFGPRQDPNGSYAAVIPKFVSQFMAHESPVVNGNGLYSRDFTFVDNVVRMVELCLSTNNPSAINTVYNVACGEKTSINELVLHIQKLLSQVDNQIENIKIEYGTNRQGDIPHSLADISKAQQLLEYLPVANFEKGLYKTIEWYTNNMISKKSKS